MTVLQGESPTHAAAVPREKTADRETRAHEVERRERADGRSMADEQAVVLEQAIAKVTRALASTDDPRAAAELVTERRAMRQELDARRRKLAGNVFDIGARGR
ncbi:MAG TPA: hypothetical protein VEK07_13020 [Polyangiaceae bacterium]|nr:hypothetical protein [Polyangiaceae bacterium]